MKTIFIFFSIGRNLAQSVESVHSTYEGAIKAADSRARAYHLDGNVQATTTDTHMNVVYYRNKRGNLEQMIIERELQA